MYYGCIRYRLICYGIIYSVGHQCISLERIVYATLPETALSPLRRILPSPTPQ